MSYNITSTNTGVVLSNGTTQNPSTVVGGAYVTNTTASHGGDAIYGSATYPWTITNYGTVAATQAGSKAIDLTAGGTVTNAGLISGAEYGVRIAAGVGLVNNTGSIARTGAGGSIFYGAVGLTAGGTVVNSGRITAGSETAGHAVGIVGAGTLINSGYISNSGNAAVFIGGPAASVANMGTIASSGSSGVNLGNGGYLTNSLGGLIEGIVDGIYVPNTASAAGTVVNAGTIEATGTGSTGVNLQAGGYVTNAGTGLISAATAGDAVVVNGTIGTVINAGSITGGNLGVWLEAGGSVSNSGSIAATDPNTGDGATFGNAGSGAGTLLNTGQISAPNLAVWLEAGGYVGNGVGGTISGGSDGVLVSTSAGTVNNFGTITGTGGTGNGVYLTGGGLVVNHAGRAGGLGPPVPPGLISGYDGVRIAGPAGTGTLLNDGNIVSTGTGFGAQAVDFLAGGTLYNYGAILGTNTDASGINAGSADDTIINGATSNGSATIAGWLNGIDQFAGVGTVINFATISSSNGTAIDLQQGGTVDNRGGPGGLISGYNNGVQVGGGTGTVINRGSITATGTAAPTGVYLGGGGSVDNFGTVSAVGSNSGLGVNFGHGGSLTNEFGALITASADGVVISGTYGSVNNFGSIAGGVDGVVLKATGAALSNSGRIVGLSSYGLYLYAGGSATNEAGGLIEGAYQGILSTHTAANVVNLGSVLAINDNSTGIRFAVAGSTLTNAGTVEGAVGAVIFTGAGNRLIVDPGAAFFGSVNGGGGGNDVLELAAGTTGTLSGSQYTGFDTTQIDAGASWDVAGVYTIPAGGTLLDFGTLTNLGTLLGSGAQLIVDPGTFVNSGYVNTTVTLDGGSYLDNTSTGTITVAGTAVLGLNSPNTVVNAGTIVGSGSGTSGRGIDLRAGGSVSNAGVISAGGGGVYVSGSAGTLDNAGTIAATAGSSVYFAAGGTVTNSGTIENSGTHDAVLFNNAAGSVFNSGTIAGGTDAPAPAAPGAAPANGDTVFDTTPSWDGRSFINAFGSPDTATYGQTFVAPADNVLQNFTFYLEGSATLQFQAQIYAWSGNLLGGNAPQGATGPALFTSTPITLGPTGGVFQPVTVNTGGVTLTAGGHYIALLTVSGPDPTDFTNSGSGEVWGDTQRTHVANDGGGGFNFYNNANNFAALNGSSWDDFSDFGDLAWIATFTPGTPAGVDLAAGGSVSNAAGGLIEGGIGVSVGAAAGTVDNSGMITGTGSAGIGVELRAGGTVSNSSTITGGGGGVDILGGGGTVDNSGMIGSTGSAGIGVYLGAGGTVSNSGTLSGDRFGLEVVGGTGAVANSGTIIHSGLNAVGAAIYLGSGGTLANHGRIVGSGTSGTSGGPSIGVVIFHGLPETGTVNNFGTIATTTTNGDGVHLDAGGKLFNGSSEETTALITAASTGIYVGGTSGIRTPGALGFVYNYGTIVGSGANAIGVALNAGGSVTNGAGGATTALISGQDNGININGSAGTVVNFATVQALGSITNVNGSIVAGNAVDLVAGGSVINGASNSTAALVEGYHIGIGAGASATATVVNFGTIVSLETAVNGFEGAGVQLGGGGSVSNYGLIRVAQGDGVDIGSASGGIGTITNFGTILATGTLLSPQGFHAKSAYLGHGGTVINGSPMVTSALMQSYEKAIYAGGSAGHAFFGAYTTLVNWGTVAATGTGTATTASNVNFAAGGLVVNHGLISSAAKTAIAIGTTSFASVGIVSNYGTIRSLGTGASGVYLGQGGTVANQTGGLVYGATGVSIRGAAGTITNQGTIQSTATGTAGEAVFLGAGGSVVNYGLITGARPPVMVGTATGHAGVVTTATVGATVDNFGTISSDANSNNGINLLHGGLVFNAVGGLILGSNGGVYGGGHLANNGINYSYAGAVTTVVNFGTIQNTTSTASDVRIVAGGTVINRGLIDSPRTGISFGSAGGTVDNFGTVRSTAATSFTAGSAIYLQSGGLITNEAGGVVTAQRNAVALGGTTGAGATVTNLGVLFGSRGVSINAADSGSTTIDNFGVITGSGGTAISLGGGADLVILEQGSVLSGAIAGFAPADTLDLVAVPFSTSDTVTFDGTSLTVSGGGVSESVDLAGVAAGTDFILESDAHGDAQIGPVTSGSNIVVSSGQVLTVLAGQNVSNVTVQSGGVLDVASGGVASGATIEAGGVETVFAGGTDSGATVSSGGFEDVFGNAVATLVLNGGSQTVEAGGTASAVVLDGAGLETVSGFAGGTVVGSGDEELVTSGGVASGSVISSGGSEIVLSGGLTSDTTIAGGTLELESGASASGLVSFAGSGGVLQLDSPTMPEAAVAGLLTGDVIDFRALPFAGSDTVAFDGTSLTVSGGGVSETVTLTGLGASSVFLLGSDGSGGTDAGLVPASGAVVSAGEVLHISAGETLSGVTVLSGGVLEVDAGGVALGTMVSSGGEELVLSGGTDSGAVISSGGFEDVFGSASATLVLNGGSQTVEAGGSVTGAVLDGTGLQTVSGVAIGTVVSAGDEQLVVSGGVAIGTTVLSGGLIVVASGGVASGAVISSGGEAVVSSGGVDRGAVISNGGEAVVSAGGVDRGAAVSGGGVEEVFGSGGGTVVLSGGEQLVEPGGSASGTVISQGGLERVLGGVTSDTTIAGGELEVTTGAVAEGVIGFGGVVGTLRLDSLATPAATLGGVVAGDLIDLSLLSFATSDTATLGQNNLLTVSGGGESVSLQFDASVAGKGFALSDDGSGGALLTLTPQAPQANLFDFVFIYNGGQDYYLGRVADDGRFGYTVGETKTNAAGSYIIFGEEKGAASAAAGSVFVDYYSHGGPGAASGIPVKTAAGSADGTAGLGSESDTLLGLDGAGHAFSSTQPAVFATTALFGFVFTYADGAAYTGTVADNTSGGLPGSRTVTDGSGNLLGVYTIFREGVTSRAAGSVVIDRFVANGIAVLANHASSTAVDGRNGLGSEVGSVTVGSVNHAFGPREEPVVTGSAPTEPAASTPPVSDVIANEVDRIFVDILGRFPSQGEFDTTGGELGQGTSTGDVRAALAGGSEASGDVVGLYGQVFGRAATTGEISGATGMLADGGSLSSLQQQLANSSEASGDINQVYRDILGHDADPSGLASFVAALGDETPGHLTDPGGLAGLAGVRDVLAHSGQAENALTTLFDGIIGRDPSNAELVGMEDRLVTAGTTEATLKSALKATGSAGGFTTIAAPGGNASLSAPSGPSLFQFSDVAFNDTITGFNAGRDTIQLPKTVAADFPTIERDTTGISGGSLITLNQNQSIFLAGLPPTKLAAGNFLLL